MECRSTHCSFASGIFGINMSALAKEHKRIERAPTAPLSPERLLLQPLIVKIPNCITIIVNEVR